MKTKKVLFLIFLLLCSSPNSYAEIDSDKIVGDVQQQGPAGTLRLKFDKEYLASYASIQPNSLHAWFKSVLPVCANRDDLECIESLSYRSSENEEWQQAKLLPRRTFDLFGQVAMTYTNDGSTQLFGKVMRNIELARPLGDVASSWELPKAPHAGGTEYLLTVVVSNFPRGYLQSTYDFSIELEAVKYKNNSTLFKYDPILRFNLPSNIDYRLKIRLGFLETKISNWYNGRISNPTVSLENGLLDIFGKPNFAPISGTSYFECEMIDEKKKTLLRSLSGGQDLSDMCNKTSHSWVLSVIDPLAFDFFDNWYADLAEYGKNVTWSLNSTLDLSACKNATLAGFVTSNALLYTPSPPKFDPISRELSYRLASTHLDASGEVNKGRFNLVLNKEVARCLWGIEAEKLADAKIQVTYSDGKPIIGTSTMNVSGDWVYIDIENFTFSSPTFNIRAIEEVKVAPTSTPSSSATIEPDPVINSSTKIIRKSTITCFKGKLTKKVTATNPKCPAGYKKK